MNEELLLEIFPEELKADPWRGRLCYYLGTFFMCLGGLSAAIGFAQWVTGWKNYGFIIIAFLGGALVGFFGWFTREVGKEYLYPLDHSMFVYLLRQGKSLYDDGLLEPKADIDPSLATNDYSQYSIIDLVQVMGHIEHSKAPANSEALKIELKKRICNLSQRGVFADAKKDA